MQVSQIRKSFRIPRGDRVFVKCYGTTNEDANLTKINIHDKVFDEFEPRQIFYILDSDPRLVLEFDEKQYIRILRLLDNGNNI